MSQEKSSIKKWKKQRWKPLNFAVNLINYGLEDLLCWCWKSNIDRRLSTLGKIHPSATILCKDFITLLFTYITEIRRTFYALEKFITWMKFIPNCDVACLVYGKLKLIGKIIPLLQQTWNSVVPSSSHKMLERVFHLCSSCSFPFLVHVRHFLNRTIEFLAPPLASAIGTLLVRLMVALPLTVRPMVSNWLGSKDILIDLFIFQRCPPHCWVEHHFCLWWI